MGRKSGPKTGGRVAGMPNKRSLRAQEMAEELGVDPLKILLMIAKKDWKGLGYTKPTETKYSMHGHPYEVDLIPLPMRAFAAKEAAPYVNPRLKNVEHSVPGGEALEPVVIYHTQWTTTADKKDDDADKDT